jgi:hypothetical protein
MREKIESAKMHTVLDNVSSSSSSSFSSLSTLQSKQSHSVKFVKKKGEKKR